MKADQYSRNDSVKVKARANYLCESCGSDQMVQAHAPSGDHSDWRNGVCLCAGCHADQHPDMPRNLFFTWVQQPYWPNVSARSLAHEFGCHNRTVIRAAKRLRIANGVVLSDVDKQQLRRSVQSKGGSRSELVLKTPLSYKLSTAQEVAAALDVSDESVYRLCRGKRIKAMRVGKQWRIPRESVDEFLRSVYNLGSL